jgi:hypothetical protein
MWVFNGSEDSYYDFWAIIPCSLVGFFIDVSEERTASTITVETTFPPKMEAVGSSKTLVITC